MHLLSNLLGPNDLIKSIIAEDWNSVKAICDVHPSQARAWSTRKGFFDGEHDSHLLPLHQAAALRPPIHAFDALIQAYPQAALCKETSFKRLPIHVALQSGDSCDVVRLLLSYAPDSAMQRDVLERVPLHYACSNGASVRTISVLLSAYKSGAMVSDLHGWLPIHVACFYGAPYAVIHKLVEAFPDSVHKKTDKGSTPLKLMRKVNARDKVQIMELLQTQSTCDYLPKPYESAGRPKEKEAGNHSSNRNTTAYNEAGFNDAAHGNVRRRHHHSAISA